MFKNDKKKEKKLIVGLYSFTHSTKKKNIDSKFNEEKKAHRKKFVKGKE
jgi:hypothetical protein